MLISFSQVYVECLAKLMKTVRQIFGEKVRELRKAKGWSQEELAFRASLHRNYLGGIERGERNPALDNICAIAKALGVDPSELLRIKKDKQTVK
jgi:transcriptional regulator with XRE-family HTH domain